MLRPAQLNRFRKGSPFITYAKFSNFLPSDAHKDACVSGDGDFSQSFTWVWNGSFLNVFRPLEKSFDTLTFFQKIFTGESISWVNVTYEQTSRL